MVREPGAEDADSGAGVGRLHALWTLAGLDQLDAESLGAALRDPLAGVRGGAVRALAETGLESGDAHLNEAALQVAEDPDPQARLAGLLSLADRVAAGVIEPPRALLRTALHRNQGDAWLRRAVLACVQTGEGEFFEAVLGGVIEDRVRDLNAETLRELAALVAARLRAGGDLMRILERLGAIEVPQGAAHPVTAVLEGLHTGIQRNPAREGIRPEDAGARLDAIAAVGDLPARTAAWRLADALGLPPSDELRAALDEAARRASDSGIGTEERIGSIRLLALAEFSAASKTLFGLLDGTQPSRIQEAAFDVIRDHRVAAVAEGLIEAWATLAPNLRPAVVNLLVYRSVFHEPLLSAIEDGRLQLGELNLDLEHRRALLRHAAPRIRERAAKFVSDEEYSNRKVIVEEWLGRLPENGDPARGRPLYERICAQCHRAGDLGHSVGPDLTSVAHRSVEDLLSNILDPNMAMNPVYVAFVAELVDGEEETGILAAENPSAVTLLQAYGRTVEIPRNRIRQLRSGGRSLMPDGLETGLTPADLRDLIAFLQESPADAPRVNRKP